MRGGEPTVATVPRTSLIPADHDHIGLKTLAFTEDCIYGCFVQDFGFDVPGQRRESVRRARSAAVSASRSSAVNRIDRLYSARVLRALITRTRFRAGHGKSRVVAIAAWAGRDPSVATGTRSSFSSHRVLRDHSSVNLSSVGPAVGGRNHRQFSALRAQRFARC